MLRVHATGHETKNKLIGFVDKKIEFPDGLLLGLSMHSFYGRMTNHSKWQYAVISHILLSKKTLKDELITGYVVQAWWVEYVDFLRVSGQIYREWVVEKAEIKQGCNPVNTNIKNDKSCRFEKEWNPHQERSDNFARFIWNYT